MNSPVLRAFGEWLMTAVVAFVIMEIADRVLPGHRLTLPVIAASIGRRPWGSSLPRPRRQWCGEPVPAGRAGLSVR